MPQPERAGLDGGAVVQQRSQRRPVVRRGTGFHEFSQHLGPGPSGRCAVHLRATAVHRPPACRAQPARRGGRQSGLARPRFAGDPEHRAPAGSDSACRGIDLGEFLGPAVSGGLGAIRRRHLRYRRLRKRPGRLQMVGLTKDVAFEVAQRAARFQAQLVDQVVPGAPQHLQGVGLPPGPIQRGGQHGGRALPAGVLADMSFQPGDDGAVPAEFHLGSGLGFDRGQPEFGQPGHLGCRPQRIARTGERVSRPAGQRPLEPAHPLLWIRFFVRRSDSGLELPGVDGVDRQSQAIAGRGTDQDAGRGPPLPARLQPAPQMRHIDLQRRQRLGWRLALPEIVDEPVDRHGVAVRDHQPRQQCPLQPGTEIHRVVTDPGLYRAEHLHPNRAVPRHVPRHGRGAVLTGVPAPGRRRTAPVRRGFARCRRVAGDSPGSPPASGWYRACR
ncbi:hypothetical protein BN975_03559 [Mycolicibacterium farcinogenes]|nr:hypothetical protein BN975_03559 [Mycolicibacterium farcinogenes]